MARERSGARGDSYGAITSKGFAANETRLVGNGPFFGGPVAVPGNKPVCAGRPPFRWLAGGRLTLRG